jgi:hypothetical protein
MTARIFIPTCVILGLVAPVATAAKETRVAVEAIITLHRLGSENWQLDIENSTPAPVTIRQITWEPPTGLTVGRIVNSLGGTCTPSDGGFQCKTKLAAPSCRTCKGDDLTVHFKATGLDARWVTTSTGGYWEYDALQPGHAVLVASPARVQTSTG